MYDKYKDKVNIFCVYILEAHFVENDMEGWPIGTLYRYPQHKTIRERIDMATKFIEDYDFKVPMYVDTMQDSFNTKFNIWPDKCIVVRTSESGRSTEILFTALLEDASRTVSKWTKDVTDFLEAQL